MQKRAFLSQKWQINEQNRQIKCGVNFFKKLNFFIFLDLLVYKLAVHADLRALRIQLMPADTFIFIDVPFLINMAAGAASECASVAQCSWQCHTDLRNIGHHCQHQYHHGIEWQHRFDNFFNR